MVTHATRFAVGVVCAISLTAVGMVPAQAAAAAQQAPVGVLAHVLSKVGQQPNPGTSKKSVKVTDQELRVAVEAWTVAAKAYKAAVAARAAAVMVINDTFTASVKHAKADFDVTKAQANTPAAKSAAAARFADAVSAAAAVRQAALDALPALPPAPGPKPTLKSVAAAKQQSSGAAVPFGG